MPLKERVLAKGWEAYLFRCSELGKLAIKPRGKSPRDKYEEAVKKREEMSDKIDECGRKMLDGKSLTKTDEKIMEKAAKLDDDIEVLKLGIDKPWLSETTKAYLSEVYIRVMYGREKDIKNKYMEKGLLLEEDAITNHSLLRNKFYKKNTVELANDFIMGSFDYEDEEADMIKDAKVNWDIFTFFKTATQPIYIIYRWQLKGYMWLRGRKNAELVYSLLNTPEHLIAIEEKKLLYDFVGSAEDYAQACLELRKNHTYDDMAPEDKEKVYKVFHDDADIEFIKQQIVHARNYLNNFKSIKNKEDESESEEVDE